jgi:Pvc16 N-terminal domain
MIPEIDRALVNLLSTQTYAEEKVRVDLDPPTKDWAARRTGPVLNLFLNDIREDTERRSADIVEVRDDKGIIVARRPAERTFLFSYALSAWTSRPEDDHALLSAALGALLRREYLPEELCDGVLAELASLGRPAMIRVGGVLYSERLVTELWSAIGGEFRPIIALTVSSLVPAGLPVPAGPPQTEPPQFTVGSTTTGATSTFSGAGRDRSDVDPQAGRTRAPADQSDAPPPAQPKRSRGSR